MSESTVQQLEGSQWALLSTPDVLKKRLRMIEMKRGAHVYLLGIAGGVKVLIPMNVSCSPPTERIKDVTLVVAGAFRLKVDSKVIDGTITNRIVRVGIDDASACEAVAKLLREVSPGLEIYRI